MKLLVTIPQPQHSPKFMKTLLFPLLVLGGLILFSSCESNDYDDDDDDNRRYRGGGTTTTTTEETTVSSPFSQAPVSTTVETQTTRAY
jgi:hypothetical protein